MRGRLLLCLIAAAMLPTVPLWAAVYRSNSIGQPLEPIEVQEPSPHRYILQIEQPSPQQERRLLFDRGTLVLQVDRMVTNGGTGNRSVTEQTFDERGAPIGTVITWYEQDLPRRIERNADGHMFLTLHSYADGQLVETKELVDGELAYMITYYRGSEGNLGAVRVIGTADGTIRNLHARIDDMFVFAEEVTGRFSKLTFHPGDLIVQDIWSDSASVLETTVSRDEGGRLVVVEQSPENSRTKTYGPDGMLLSQKESTPDGAKRTMSYQYDALGVLDQSVELIEGTRTQRIERWYGKGILQNQTEWLDGTPVRSVRYLPDGTSVVTLFEQGRPYADVTYAADGKRVLSLEYRMER